MDARPILLLGCIRQRTRGIGGDQMRAQSEDGDGSVESRHTKPGGGRG
jgi:hypothetical protein